MQTKGEVKKLILMKMSGKFVNGIQKRVIHRNPKQMRQSKNKVGEIIKQRPKPGDLKNTEKKFKLKLTQEVHKRLTRLGNTGNKYNR